VKKAFSILYADTEILAVDKPAGVLAVPDHWDPDVPVAREMLSKDFGRLLPVHRIDKDTTGVLVYARNERAHRELNERFATRQVEKTYFAIVHGEPEGEAWEVELSLRADGDRDHRTIIDASKGKPSKTRFEVVERFRGFALVRALPETGRTHQIRVHLAASSLRIVADPLYGDGAPLMLSALKRRWKGDVYEERPLMARTALHAARIAFQHPTGGAMLEIEAPLPRDFRATLAQLRKLRP
jgi:RluA family pseudouridine synthase